MNSRRKNVHLREMMKATALKAYLQRNNIRPSSLAEKCHINKGYLSKLLNGQRPNPRFPVLVCLANTLGLSVSLLQELLQTSYDSFILDNTQEVLSEKVAKENFFNYLQKILDAADQVDFSMVTNISKVISSEVPDSVPLKANYLCWYEAYSLTFQNKFESAIPLFLEGAIFTPRHNIEKRFKAKILVGLGAAYMARGEYRQSIKVFRQSLFLWDEGFHVARVNMNLGTLYRRLAEYELSVSTYEKAYELGTSAIKFYALSGLIQISLDKKDYSAARKYVNKGYTQAKTFDSPRGKEDLYCSIAEYYFAIGKLHRSEAFFRKAIFFADNTKNLRTKQWAEAELAILFVRKGLVKEFNDLIKKLESELSGNEDTLLIAKHLIAKGRYHLARYEYLTVIHLVQKSYRLLISCCSPEFKECCEILYKAYQALNEPKMAHFYLTEIRMLRKKMR